MAENSAEYIALRNEARKRDEEAARRAEVDALAATLKAARDQAEAARREAGKSDPYSPFWTPAARY